MKLKKNIAISETGFVFNPLTGDSFSTNEVGASIIQQLKEGKDGDTIKNYILENYNIDEDGFEKDYYDFTIVLKNYKLIDEDAQ